MFYHSHPNIYVFLKLSPNQQCSRTIRNNKISTEKQHFLIQHAQQHEEGEINRLEYIQEDFLKI